MQLNPLTGLLPATIGLAVATLYLTGTVRLHGSRRPWPRLRTASFLAGVATISAGFLLPGFLGASVHDPRVAMTTHLLTGMVGPLLIALSAPVILALRALGPRGRRRLTAVLGRPWVRFLGHPMTATVLSVGGVYVLYLTPLYARVHDAAVLGLLVHAHVVVAAALVAWAIVGVDHVPHRPSMRVRGAALVLVVLLHTVLSRLLFADADRLAAEAGGTAGEWRAAAELMWYEGDLVELALVLAFVAQLPRRRESRRRADPHAHRLGRAKRRAPSGSQERPWGRQNTVSPSADRGETIR